MEINRIIAVDPGKDKCGVAVVTRAGAVEHKEIAATGAVVDKIGALLKPGGVGAVAVGAGGGGAALAERLRGLFPDMTIETVEEKNTTRQARDRFFAENPTKRFLAVFPLSLFLPQPVVDDYAAVIIGERFFRSLGE